MITTHIKNLESRCRERGKTLEQAVGCVVSRKGDIITVDTSHPDYPRPGLEVMSPKQPSSRSIARPGLSLKKTLKSLLGISASPNCRCNSHARTMDEMEASEPGWCMKNIDKIVGWLEEEARARKLPFFRYAAKLLVKRAIRLSYKKAEN